MSHFIDKIQQKIEKLKIHFAPQFEDILTNHYRGIFLGSSIARQELKQNIDQATKNNSRVLLIGACGHG